MAAAQYLKNVADDFEAYAEAHYLPAVKQRGPDDLDLLAGLRFIETRKLDGYQGRLKELFTTRRAGAIGREIDEACLGALLATSDDPPATAGFLAVVAAAPRPLPTSAVAKKALRQQGAAGIEAILHELSEPHDGRRLRGLARLLMDLCPVIPPEPIGFWEKSEQARRREASDRWREKIRKAGRLPSD